jgi:hypothetical protein
MTERASQQGAWYDGESFDIGQRVTIIDAAERVQAGGEQGRIVGYDASGPRRGEDFVRVLVMVDGPDPAIVALPPQALRGETASGELEGLARTLLVQLQQLLGERGYPTLREWLLSEQARSIAADPGVSRRNIHLGQISIPGLLIAPMIRLLEAES